MLCVIGVISSYGWFKDSKRLELLRIGASAMMEKIKKQEEEIHALKSWISILENNAKEEVEVDLDVDR
jgi:hypothetical protein